MDKNPLYYIPLKTNNKSGRPTNEKLIKFGPQPQSYVSQLLKNVQVKNENLGTTDNNTHCEILSEDQTSDNTFEHIAGIECTFSSTKPINDAHEKTESNRYSTIHKNVLHSCDYPTCSYSTKLSSNLIKHKRTHSKEKPYLCDRCSFRSNFVNSLKAHKRIHTNERPYSCNFCSYRCNSTSNLKKHCKHRHWNMT